MCYVHDVMGFQSYEDKKLELLTTRDQVHVDLFSDLMMCYLNDITSLSGYGGNRERDFC